MHYIYQDYSFPEVCLIFKEVTFSRGLFVILTLDTYLEEKCKTNRRGEKGGKILPGRF